MSTAEVPRLVLHPPGSGGDNAAGGLESGKRAFVEPTHTGAIRLPSDSKVPSSKRDLWQQLLVPSKRDAGAAAAVNGGIISASGAVVPHSSSNRQPYRMAKTVRSNTGAEDRLLAAAELYRRQFDPQRRKLLLCPKNEAGVQKFCSTFIRPTMLPLLNTYSLEKCASFVADSVEYLPLDDAYRLPDTVHSVDAVARLRKADSLDLAVFLASLLRGHGFHAFVVSGYTPLWLARRDLRQVECPFLSAEDDDVAGPAGAAVAAAVTTVNADSSKPTGSVPDSSEPAAASTGAPTDASAADVSNAMSVAAPVAKGKYVLRQPVQHFSKFVAAQQKQQQQQQQLLPNGTAHHASSEASAAGADNPLPGSATANVTDSTKRAASSILRSKTPVPVVEPPASASSPVHWWVLVLPSKREITEPLWVEPTTGAVTSVKQAVLPYLAVEYVFNESNVYINKRPNLKPQALQFMLHDPLHWEPVLPEGMLPGHTSADLLLHEAQQTEQGSSSSEATTDAAATGADVSSPAGAPIAKPDVSGGASGVVSAAASPSETTAPAAASVAAAVTNASPSTDTALPSADQPITPAAEPVSSTGAAKSSSRPASARPLSAQTQAKSTAVPVAVPAAATAPKLRPVQPLDAAVTWCPRPPIDRDSVFVRYPNGQRVDRYRRCVVERFSEYFTPYPASAQHAASAEKRAMGATSWATQGVPNDEYHRPAGTPGFEGLVQRVTVFADDACTVVDQIREVFKHRRDRLISRVRVPAISRTEETYLHGRPGGLKRYIEQDAPEAAIAASSAGTSPGIGASGSLNALTVLHGKRILEFYPKSRLDGLVRREEVVGLKIVESYEHREDRLIYRSIAVDSSEDSNGRIRTKGFAIPVMVPLVTDTGAGAAADSTASPASPAGGAAASSSSAAAAAAAAASGGLVQQEMSVIKIAEKYQRDPTGQLPADKDVRKRTHFIARGQIRLDYHFGAEKITSSQLLFDKNTEVCSGHRADVMAAPPSPSSIRAQLQSLLSLEKTLMGKVKEREREMHELLTMLLRDRQTVVLERSLHRAAYEKAKEEGGMMSVLSRSSQPADRSSSVIAASSNDRSTSRTGDAADDGDDPASRAELDYLSPFLAQFPPNKPLTRKQALQVKEECLRSLKERLLERANIIQAHLDAEYDALKQRQALFNRANAPAAAAAAAPSTIGGGGDASSAAAATPVSTDPSATPASPSGAAAATSTADDFRAFHEETMFRVSILQARLARHEESALQQYAQLDAKLWEDPRLGLSAPDRERVGSMSHGQS